MHSTFSNTSVAIQFHKSHLVCDTEMGQINITWPKNSGVIEGLLGKNIFAEGATKYVFMVSGSSDVWQTLNWNMLYNSCSFVLDQNSLLWSASLRLALTLKLVWLRMKTIWRVTSFDWRWYCGCWKNSNRPQERVKQASLQVWVVLCAIILCGWNVVDIFVSEGFLIYEIGLPSVASGLPASDKDQAMWLVEPRHTKSVQKFSGTLVYPNHSNKVGITLVAFTHFTYEISHKGLIFVDIQGLKLLSIGI